MSKLKMSEQEIYFYTKKFLKDAYGMELAIPVKINGRLKTTLGRFRSRRENTPEGIKRIPLSIEISRNYLINGKLEQIKRTLKHEAIHYALYVQGRNYKDGQKDFENELIKHGSHSTRTVNVKVKQLKVTYECGCGNEWHYARRLSNTYSCGSCEGILKETKREHVYA